MDELSCKTHCAVMRSVFNLPSASEGVQRAFPDTGRPGGRRRAGQECRESKLCLEETLRDAPRALVEETQFGVKI